MTEISAQPVEPLRFWRLRPVAFFSALLLAPVAMALIGAVTLPIGIGFIILFSIPFGAAAYLGAFAPLAWLAIVARFSGVGEMALIGALANLAAAALFGTWMLVFEGWEEARDAVTFVHGFGLIFAPIYGALFGAFYGWLRPDPIDR